MMNTVGGYVYIKALRIARNEGTLSSIPTLLEAVRLGNGKAAYALGRIYLEGDIGIEPNIAYAALFFKLSARHLERSGIHDLGVMYYKGNGVTKSNALALFYFFIGSQLGDNLCSSSVSFLLDEVIQSFDLKFVSKIWWRAQTTINTLKNNKEISIKFAGKIGLMQ
ncbi:tetratricopeptide repeat protein [Niveispirillum irakense]|uniref:tetratricopeptide repeat protein n=1 Tax=Niveispirillum irakense TaxID=34011 RepID=UPI0009FE22C0|nr:SEL1-like repeat protein [Niveispirillum irakense]